MQTDFRYVYYEVFHPVFFLIFTTSLVKQVMTASPFQMTVENRITIPLFFLHVPLSLKKHT